MSRLDDILDGWKGRSEPFMISGGSVADDCVGCETLLEVISHFGSDGRERQDLLRRMRFHYSAYLSGDSRIIDHSRDFVQDPPDFVSTEYYWLLTCEMKRVKGDWGYHFDSDTPLFSRDHRFFELGPIQGTIFAEVSDGKGRVGVGSDTFAAAVKVFRGLMEDRFYEQVSRDVGGVVTRELSGHSVRKDCEEYCSARILELFDTVNSFVVNEKYHMSPDRIVVPNVYYNMRYTANFYDLLRIHSGEEDILQLIGRENMPEKIKRLMRPFSIDFCYRMVAYFANRFTTAVRISYVPGGGINQAIIRLEPPEDLKVEAGKYLLRFLLSGT